jgi:hypothetical protein
MKKALSAIGLATVFLFLTNSSFAADPDTTVFVTISDVPIPDDVPVFDPPVLPTPPGQAQG